MPDQQIVSRPYTYAEVRAPRATPAQSEPTTFEVSATAAVPAALLEAAKGEAVAAGFASGWAHGVHEATAAMERDVRESARLVAELTVQRRTAVQTAVAALNRAAAVMVSDSRESAEEIEDIVLARAVELAELLLQRELTLSDTVAQDALARALRYVPGEVPVTVRLAPADHATLTEDPTVLGADAQRLTLLADPSLSPGDCIAICGVTRVDARLGEGLARMKAILAQ